MGPVEVDARRYEMKAHGQTHSLTPRELKLLSLFRERPGEALSRDYLLDQAWGIDYLGTTRTLDQHVAQLRKKVENDPSDPRFLITVHGVGYRWADES
jgi:DNA-binding response OmpR family regulator